MLNNKVGAENVTKKIGDGSKTLFWHESWLGEQKILINRVLIVHSSFPH